MKSAPFKGLVFTMLKNSILTVALLGAAFLPPHTQAQDHYPEGKDIPKYMTREEARRWNPPSLPRSTAPPPGPIWNPGEHEEMDGILISWRGSTSQQNVLVDIAKHVTGPAGRAHIYTVVNSTATQNTVSAQFAGAGVNMNRVRFIVAPTDTIWIRDYGPRYIYQGQVRSIVDHTYNRPRPNDDLFPTVFAGYKNHARYTIPLIHGGGNFHNDSVGRSFVTRLINQENPSLSEGQIRDLWWDYQRVDTAFHNRFPTNVDSTGHIDMWMQVVSDNRVIISYWPNNPGSTQAIICDNAATIMAANGWTVYRTPAILSGGVHYTYTNSVICNDVVMMPTYTGFTGAATRNAEALAVFQQAFPNRQVVQVNAQPLITSAGALHCVTMHVPAHLGGENPTAIVLSPTQGTAVTGGQPMTIEWLADDNNAVQNVDIYYRTEWHGRDYAPLALGIPNTGSHTLTTPSLPSRFCKVMIVASDFDGNTGVAFSEGFFEIKPGARP
jgi:agmatine deiminase